MASPRDDVALDQPAVPVGEGRAGLMPLFPMQLHLARWEPLDALYSHASIHSGSELLPRTGFWEKFSRFVFTFSVSQWVQLWLLQGL